MRKKPATAELLNWLTTLRELAPNAVDPFMQEPGAVRASVSSLAKTFDDQARAREVIEQWLPKARS